jgi:hypothetical protein
MHSLVYSDLTLRMIVIMGQVERHHEHRNDRIAISTYRQHAARSRDWGKRTVYREIRRLIVARKLCSGQRCLLDEPHHLPVVPTPKKTGRAAISPIYIPGPSSSKSCPQAPKRYLMQLRRVR